MSYFHNTLEPSLKRGQPLYKGQDAWSQVILYMEVPLYLWLYSYTSLPCLLHQVSYTPQEI